MIVCRMLGPVDLTIDGSPAPPELAWRKNLALLVYLARSPRRTRSREHLLGLLWPEKPDTAARHSLNVALGHLRRHGGDDIVTTDAGQVRLAEDRVELDTDRFERLRRSGDFLAAAGLVFGDFLEGLVLDTCSNFEDWLAGERRLWRERSVDALCGASEIRLAEGHTDTAVELARRALALDAMNEQAVRAAMRALALASHGGEALLVYDDFSARLAEESSTAPDPSTVSLAGRIKRLRHAGGDQRPGAPIVGDTRRTPLIGREAELTTLYGAWTGGRAAREATLLILEGDPGVGKTRLAEELLGRARLDGGAIVELRAVPGDVGTPCSGLDGIADGGLLEAPGIAAAPPAALAALVSRSARWADRFRASVNGVDPAPLPRALSDILRAAADEAPVSLFIDDAQWLDSESALTIGSVLRDLASHAFTVLLCLAPHARHDAIGELRQRIGRDLRGVSVKLGPLSTEALRSLAAWAVPTYDAGQLDRLTRRVATDSAGLPLFASELLNGVALGLDLKGVASAWPEPQRTLDQSLPGDLPDAIVAAIRTGFWRLSKEAQRALTVAALLPDRIKPELVGAGSGLQGEELNHTLDELEWHRWLAADARGYTFVARVVRLVVARDMLTEGQRQRLLATLSSVNTPGPT